MAPRQLFYLLKVSIRGFLLVYFQLLSRPREQRLREFKSKDFMSDEGKIENEIINYSVNRVNKCNQAKNERELRKLIAESCPNSSNKMGVKGILVSIPALLQLQLEKRKISELQITKNSLSQRFPFNSRKCKYSCRL